MAEIAPMRPALIVPCFGPALAGCIFSSNDPPPPAAGTTVVVPSASATTP
jgi:hypothetical protein